MRAKITFSGNPRLTLNSLNRLTQKLFVQRGLTNAVRGVHEKTEALAKAYLMQSVRNPDATPPGTGQITRAIQKNITSKVFRVGKSVIGGTGNIKQMNEADPIHGLNRDIKSGVSLWRILETGTKPHLITAVNANKLKFFSLKKGVWVVKKTVRHPGQLGRFYFHKAIQDTKYFYRIAVLFALRRIVKSESFV